MSFPSASFPGSPFLSAPVILASILRCDDVKACQFPYDVIDDVDDSLQALCII
jgi:hypothetical protein